jgi:hypothetical protein
MKSFDAISISWLYPLEGGCVSAGTRAVFHVAQNRAVCRALYSELRTVACTLRCGRWLILCAVDGGLYSEPECFYCCCSESNRPCSQF